MSIKETKYMNPKHEKQREYVESVEGAEGEIGIIVGAAFIRGIRQLGYKSTSTAIYELTDNGFQAGAKNVHVMLGFEDKSDAKPSGIAVLDDGIGMIPGMVRHAVRWGGTDREDDRKGFGRLGYGLPSATISQGRRFTVYSRIDDGDYFKVQVDLDEISQGKHVEGGQVVVPEAAPAPLPKWIQAYAKEHFDGARSLRTVVAIEKLDRVTYKTANKLKSTLIEDFGVTYRNLLRNFNLFLEGKPVLPIDPLFLTPGALYYDVDEDRAEAFPPLALRVTDKETGNEGTIKVRYSYLPPTFGRKDKSRAATKQNANPRFHFMTSTNGFIIMRNGRQIDVVSRNPWTTFVNYDRNVKIEIDFPAELDEMFAVTTAKQQVVLADSVWDALRDHGVLRAFDEMRSKFKKETKEVQVEGDHPTDDTKRASEVAMEESQKFKAPIPPDPTREERAKKVLELEAKRKSKEWSIPVGDAAERLVAEAEGRPYRLRFEARRGAPFYDVIQIGGQRVLVINTEHRFFTDLYAGADSTLRMRSALESLLWVLADSEFDAVDDRAVFYRTERSHWTTRLDVVLDRLESVVGEEEDLPEMYVEGAALKGE